MAKTSRGKEKNAKKALAENAAERAKKVQEQAIVLTPQSALIALLKADDSYKKKIDGLTGELRETIGNAVEKKHLDKKAYAMLKSLRRIEPLEKRAASFNTLLAYMEMSGDMKDILSVPELPLGGEADGADGKDDENGDEGTTRTAQVVKPTFGGGSSGRMN